MARQREASRALLLVMAMVCGVAFIGAKPLRLQTHIAPEEPGLSAVTSARPATPVNASVPLTVTVTPAAGHAPMRSRKLRAASQTNRWYDFIVKNTCKDYRLVVAAHYAAGDSSTWDTRCRMGVSPDNQVRIFSSARTEFAYHVAWAYSDWELTGRQWTGSRYYTCGGQTYAMRFYRVSPSLPRRVTMSCNCSECSFKVSYDN